MPRAVESAVRRRKLLQEIAGLAEVAVFGTLSETYRTCGNAGCHCRSGGPKHGPHLNISIAESKARPPATTCPRELNKPRAKVWPLGKNYRSACGSWQS